MESLNQELSKPNLPTPSLSSKLTSKMLLFTLIILGIGLANGYALGNNQETQKKISKTVKISPVLPSPSPTDNNFILEQKGECNSEECLFGGENNYLGGFGKIQGYYQQEKKTAWGESTLCDTLVVTGGNPILIEHFRAEVKKGNSINRIDQKDNLILTLSLKNLDAQEQGKIKSSSLNNPAELNVIRTIDEGRGAPVCYSFAHILSVKLLK